MSQRELGSKYLKNESMTIVLDSRNATTHYNGTLNSEITFEMRYPIIAPPDCLYMTWCTQSFTCPISWYLINSTNNFFSLTMNSTTYNISIHLEIITQLIFKQFF